MKVEGGTEIGASEHHLRIDDERPTFTSYFASDILFREILENSGSKWHADFPIFDQIDGTWPRERIPRREFSW